MTFESGGECVAKVRKLVATLFKKQLDLETVTKPKARFIPSTQIVVLKYPTLKRKTWVLLEEMADTKSGVRNVRDGSETSCHIN